MQKKFKIFLLLIFFVTCQVSVSGKDNIDSLLLSLKTAPDTSKAKIYNELAIEVISYSAEKALDFAQKALDLSEKFDNQKELMYAYNGLGMAYFKKGSIDKAINYNRKSLELSKKLNDKKQTAFVYNQLGVIYKQKGDYEIAINYFQKSENIYEELGIPLQTGLALSNIGNIYYFFNTDFDKALDFYERGYKLFEQAGAKNYMALVMINIGLIYEEKKQFPKALDYLFRALKIFEEIKSQSGIARVQTNLIDVYVKMHNTSLALKYAQSAYNSYKQIGDKGNTANSLQAIGRIYLENQSYETALNYFHQALSIYKEQRQKKDISETYKFISNALFGLGDFKKAYEDFQTYSSLKDSVLKDDYLKQVQEMNTKYETDKKDKELLIQKKDIEKKDLEAKRKNIFLIAVALIAILVIAFSFVLYRQFTEKKKANILLAQQNDEIKNQRDQIFQQKKEITDSIHYASRIQRAVLPSPKILEDYGLQYFILYKPRDIVSGDFYWINQKDNRVIIAAADCTGHGVPGAFMSMLGMTLLSEIVTKGEFSNAAQMLDQLRNLIVKSLHQSGKTEETKDGMDVALCILDKENSTVQYAGAFNPLILIRNSEVIETSADRMPVGFHDKLNVPFTNNELQLQKDDTLYIFSDGYIDQFGGENGKKFMSKKFKQLLASLENEAMDNQREILDKTITDWRGEMDQIDDIMVIGVRV